ncbi:cadherin-23-like [Mya arenaria]|uniref:cadherin-23-like n=1 Tax=Mya arenaria TaxID=6604 RepID=UPI0022E530DF|nr:cadherin-23-like [Mya arenaria]
MMNEPNYVIDCCGVVDKWEAYFDNVNTARTVYFQVWRPTSGDSFQLVGQNDISVSSDGEQAFAIPQAQRITVKSNDRWGWWSDGSDVITYKRGGAEEDNNYLMAISSATSVDDVVDWSAKTVEDDRSYAVRMDVEPNNDPFFTGTMSATVSNAVAIGTTLETISVSDNDVDDVSTLTVSMVSNSKYNFDTSTKVLTTVASLTTLGGSESKLTFKVADQCSNTVTVTFTVTITNDPPEIHNLPSSVSISEDVTSETLLFVINATDTGGDVTCDFAASVPASYPFIIKQEPASSDYAIYSEINPGFSYNTKSSYTLGIDCSDGLISDTGEFYVYLTQNTPPVFLNLQNSTSISTSDQIGTTAFHVLVYDAEGDDLTFTMTCTCANFPFQIFNSGEIKLNADLTDHAVVGYDLEIHVADSRNTVGPSLLTITIAGMF